MSDKSKSSKLEGSGSQISNFPRCSFTSENGTKCFRNVVETEKYCEKHLIEKTKADEIANSECPICLENDDDQPLYPLSCLHRAHLDCLEGMTNLACPLCRKRILNLPTRVKKQIERNGEKYKQEQEEQEQLAIQEMMENEEMYARLPPQMEIMLAMKYLFSLGIPVYLIPTDISLEIDPESPLPGSGYIFQLAVKNMIEGIRNQANLNEEEESELYMDEDTDDESFDFEGEDLQIIHRITTIPVPGRRSMMIASQIPAMFNTMAFHLQDLPELTEEDFRMLGLSEDYSDD